MYTDAQVQKYLDRIGYLGDTTVCLHNLAEMQKQHLLHIPYENLDLLNGTPLSLDKERLFEKIILNRRGGYCFELQGAFYYLLLTLGYNVAQYAGRFIDDTGVTQMRRHRILVTELGGKRFVCDVGVRSESPRCPLELVESIVQTDGVCEYRYEKDPFYGWVLMQKENGKDWSPMLGFTEERQIDTDYVMPSFYCEKHPDSTFNKFMKVSIFTPDSDLTIVGNTFQAYAAGKVTESRELKTNEEAVHLLKTKFGINVPQNYTNFLYNQAE